MTRLAAYANSHDPVLLIARENQSFNKPSNSATFLEAFLIPANTTNPNVAADRRRFLGDFQVNVWVRENTGSDIAETIAEEISQLFQVYPKTMLPVSIESPPNIRKSVSDSSGYRVTPILISYRMEAEN